tara:strand:+ start:918 stop:1385 length:468 start_codon:yes stop_codon:yes gene_type:complete
MIDLVEIHDGDERNVLEPKLADILSCLPLTPKEADSLLNWKLFFLGANGVLRGEKAIIPLSEEINNSINGFNTTYPSLMEMSEDLNQIIDLFLVANLGNEEINKQETDEDFYELYDYTFELFDSSYWIISCKDIKYVEALRKKFRDVSVREYIPY